jgi:hypothetical protein
MKLLLCSKCSDIRALRVTTWIRCRCHRSRARYQDENGVAEIGGEYAFLLGVANDSFVAALRRERADRESNIERALGHEFTAFIIPHASVRVRSIIFSRRARRS